MDFENVVRLISDNFGEDAIMARDEEATPPALDVSPDKLAEIGMLLHQHEQTYFDFLSCISSVDNGPEAGTLEVFYNLYSIPNNFSLMLKVSLERNETTMDSPGLEEQPDEYTGKYPVVSYKQENDGEEMANYPSLPTVSHIWRTAEWHEREAFDLMGIKFTGHSDLRRILLPRDWQGFPLRKDYQLQEKYHGIKVEY